MQEPLGKVELKWLRIHLVTVGSGTCRDLGILYTGHTGCCQVSQWGLSEQELAESQDPLQGRQKQQIGKGPKYNTTESNVCKEGA